MPDDPDPTPPVACKLTPDQVADRTGELATLAERFRGAEELEDGYTLRFDDADDGFESVAAFVADERECCAFADYVLETTPPYEETRLTITGPEGTKTMFGEGLLELLSVTGD